MVFSYKPSLYFQKYREHRQKQKVTASVLEFHLLFQEYDCLVCEFFHSRTNYIGLSVQLSSLAPVRQSQNLEGDCFQ